MKIQQTCGRIRERQLKSPAALAAQGYGLLESARIGAHIHGLAGEILAVQEGECGVLPHELPGVIGRLLR